MSFKLNILPVTLLLLIFTCENKNMKANNKNGPSNVKRILESRILKGKIPGVAYGVLNDKGLSFEFYGGKSDLKAGLPVGPDTTFMLNSSTKTLTAAGIHRPC